MSEALAAPRRVNVKRLLKPAIAVAAAAGVLVLLSNVSLPTLSGTWDMPVPVMSLGAITGLAYGLLGVGVVLVYRTNRIINFAHGEMGAFGAAIFGYAVVEWHLPYWIALPFGLALGGLVAAAAETAVIRRLRRAPRLMSIVATLGIGQLLVYLALAINLQASAGAVYPEPTFLPSFHIGVLLIGPAHVALLILGPIAVIGLAVFLRRSRYGLALRAAAAAPDTARMSGVFASRMSSLAWALAGVLSALTAILTQPSQGFSGAQSFGPSLLLRALAAAAIARMSSLPMALVAGVGLGVLEQLLLWNFAQAGSGLVQGVLFGVILAALIIQRARVGREAEERGSWASVEALRPVPDKLREIWLVRNLGAVLGVAALAFAALLPVFISNASSVTVTYLFAATIVGLSLGVVTGLGGQLSLGQFAVAGVGGIVSFHVTSHGGSFLLSFIYAGLASGAAMLILGLPALRVKGLLLTVTTLAFALIGPAWLFNQSWVLGGSVVPARPQPFGISLETGRAYYYLALVVLLLAMLVARNIRRSGLGRVLVAVRDNEDNARAFAVRATLAKAQAFILSGFLAGIAGAVYIHGLSRASGSSFPTVTSVDIALMTVIGGLGIMSGPLLGALFVIGVPAFLPLDSAGLATTSLGLLVIIMYLPGGIAQLVEPLRNRVIRFLGRRAGIDVDAAYAEATPTGEGSVQKAATDVRQVSLQQRRRRPAGTTLLRASGISKAYGGVRAVDGVSLEVRVGETVGLIGPNGAGKTTTFELLSGFGRPDTGSVWFDGRDVTVFPPEVRARLGLIRSFQDSALFPTMTVTDAVTIALERLTPTGFLSAVAGFSFSERGKQRQAREIVDLMGLRPYRDMQIQELSTGTRRITELACMVAARPTLLLFDEPSTGIAQRETEALGIVLRDIKDVLGVTLLVIEHDMPLIMGLADRIIAMADGKVIAEGPPEVVQNDPLVVEAYLGGPAPDLARSEPVALARSG